MEGLADTGAQICTAGVDLMESLGINKSYLIPTTMKVKGVTHSAMSILGAIFLEISSGGRYTKQVVYIACEACRLILSEKALCDLGVITKNFPSPDTFPSNETNTESHHTPQVNSQVIELLGNKSKCGCLVRTHVPPIPTTIPFKPTAYNRENLAGWILKHYASSAFNICEHQPIPQMTGPDMIIRIDDDVSPVAIHSPLPVPHHWKRQVKEGLGRDCRLGVIEPVPAGTPTTWCSRMVVTSKPDGTPR